MPHLRGAPRPAGSGRKKGSCNRRSITLAERVAELHLPDPVIRLLVLAERAEREGELDLAVDAYAKAAPYLAPRLAAIDMAVEDGGGLSERLASALERLKEAFAQPHPAPRPVHSIVHAPASSVIDVAADSASRLVVSPEPRSAVRQPEHVSAHGVPPGAAAPPTRSRLPQVPVFPPSIGMHAAVRPWQPSGSTLTPAVTSDGRLAYLGELTREPVERDSEE